MALGSVCLVAHAVHTEGDYTAVLGLTIVVVLACFATRGPDWRRVLPASVQVWVRWLAGISYGMYLLHQTLGILTMRWVNSLGGGSLLQVSAMTITAVLLGWLLTHFVERPVSRAAGRWLRRPPLPRLPENLSVSAHSGTGRTRVGLVPEQWTTVSRGW